jgi:hypothetical protein
MHLQRLKNDAWTYEHFSGILTTADGTEHRTFQSIIVQAFVILLCSLFNTAVSNLGRTPSKSKLRNDLET